MPFSTCADLYHQRMRYSGLDIANITLGSSCDARLVNNYSYDALHRITAMHNSLIRPGLAAENAYSTSYSYDPAGNIQRLSRRGFVGMSGNAPVYDLIDDLHYSYAGANPALNAFSSKLQGVDDGVTDAAAQPRGVFLPSSGYGYDGNGNMIGAGSVSAEYNILNLPTVLSTSSGDRKFEYVFGGGKYSAELITGNSAIDEMRHYLGGMEFKNDTLEAYNFGDGRVVFHDSVPTLRFQYRLHDHLGNTVVFFEDKNNNGCITTEDQATSQADLEIIQRLLYYPFGMALEGLGAWNAQPWQQYRYNGKERDTLTGWYDYSARWYLDGIGRFPSVDPLAGKMPGWSPYSYGFDNPVQYTDPTGMEPEGDCCPGVKKVVDRYIDNNVAFFKGAGNALWDHAKSSLRHSLMPGTVIEDGINLVRNYDQIIPGIKSSAQEGYRIFSSGTETEKYELAGYLAPTLAAALFGTKGAGLLSRAPSMAGRGGLSLGGTQSLGAGRIGVKQWLQNVGNLERSQLLNDIQSVGFQKVWEGKGMMHFERGGMKIRIDPPQPGTPYNHMHLNYGGNKNAYDIFLNPVDYKSPAAHIKIK